MEPKTALIVLAIVFLTWAFFSRIGALLEHAKLQPQIDEERRLKLALELRRQREEETANVLYGEAQQRLSEAAEHAAKLEQQLAVKQGEVAQAKEMLTGHEHELILARQAVREGEIHHMVTQTRVSDLESALSAERGRLGALQAALDAKQDLVQQLSNELASTTASIAAERASAQQREATLRDQIAEHERILSSGSSQADAFRSELERVKAAHTALEQEAEARSADWSRKLVASDSKIQLLQKEILNLVNSGGHGDAAETMVAAENLNRAQDRARAAEARVLELEEQLALGDAGTRRKLREAEYRVCELEFKLAELDEARAAAVEQSLAVQPAQEEPHPEYLAKLHEELSATKEKCLQLMKERDEARLGPHEAPIG